MFEVATVHDVEHRGSDKHHAASPQATADVTSRFYTCFGMLAPQQAFRRFVNFLSQEAQAKSAPAEDALGGPAAQARPCSSSALTAGRGAQYTIGPAPSHVAQVSGSLSGQT